MANEPSAFGLIVLTGMTIAAVVGLYAYDAIPRRDGIMPSTDIAWPRWQSNDQARWQSNNAPPSEPAQSYSQPNDQQQQQPSDQPQDQGDGPPNQPSQYPQQDPRGQNVPDDQQSGQGGAGQAASPDDAQRR